MFYRTIAPKGMPRPTGREGHVLLDAIWEYFSKHDRWPTFDDIDRKLYAKGLVFEDVVQQLCPALLRGVDAELWRLPQGSDVLGLTIAGAANCTGAGRAIRVFVTMVRIAASIEPHYQPTEPGALPELHPIDLGSEAAPADVVELNKKVTFAAFALGLHEPCFRGGGHNPEDLDWTLRYDRDIRPFADVHEVSEYWRIRERVLGPERTESDNRPFGKRPTLHTDPVPTPPAPAAATAGSPEPMSVTCNLHPEIAKAAAERFNSGFYLDAVSRAFQAIEHRVQTLAGSNEMGERLMGIAFGAKPGPPRLTVTRSTGASLESEQNGMQFLFKGATGALRNPRMHGPAEEDARDEAEEMLVFASFLMRRLDIEDDKRKAAGSGS